jgi:peptidoglycan L-alanyl-D-glutamate endopeptidase CwlK
MPKFSEKSLEKLATCDERLQKVFLAVVEKMDCTVIEGHRGEAQQNADFENGRTKLRWPHGKHNSLPAKACDVAPYPIDWNDIPRFVTFSKVVFECARDLKINLRWGGDWKGQGDLKANKFNDYPHWELKENEPTV